jgi:hypothetical protein
MTRRNPCAQLIIGRSMRLSQKSVRFGPAQRVEKRFARRKSYATMLFAAAVAFHTITVFDDSGWDARYQPLSSKTVIVWNATAAANSMVA